MPQSKQVIIYREMLAREFIREFYFLIDVASNRAAPKGDFTDGLLSIFKDVKTLLLGNVQLPLINVADYIADIVINWINDKRKEGKGEYSIKLDTEIEPEQLRILLDSVALEASRWYEFIIDTYLAEAPTEAIIPLLKTQVARMLEYIVRNQLPLSKQHLLTGIIAGRSGGFITSFQNKPLPVKTEFKNRDFTAEGLCGRPAFMTADRKYWILDPVQGSQDLLHLPAKHQRLPPKTNSTNFFDLVYRFFKIDHHDYGRTHLIENRNSLTTIFEPKYGYVMVSEDVISTFGYAPQPDPDNTLEPKLKNKLKDYKPSIQVATLKDIDDYLKTSKSKESFLTYIRRTKDNPNAERVLFEPTLEEIKIHKVAEEKIQKDPTKKGAMDLSYLNFSHSDFSYCILNNVIISGSIANMKLQHGYLIRTNLSNVTNAAGANFRHAHLEYLQAKSVHFEEVDLSYTHLNYANLTKSTIRIDKTVGAIWQRATLDDLILIDSTSNKNLDSLREELQTLQHTQETILKEQYKTIKKMQVDIETNAKEVTTLRNQINVLDKYLIEFNETIEKGNETQKKQAQQLAAHTEQIQALLITVAEEHEIRMTWVRYWQAQAEEFKHEIQLLKLDRHEDKTRLSQAEEILKEAQTAIQQLQTQNLQHLKEIEQLTQTAKDAGILLKETKQLSTWKEKQIQSKIELIKQDVQLIHEKFTQTHNDQEKTVIAIEQKFHTVQEKLEFTVSTNTSSLLPLTNNNSLQPALSLSSIISSENFVQIPRQDFERIMQNQQALEKRMQELESQLAKLLDPNNNASLLSSSNITSPNTSAFPKPMPTTPTPTSKFFISKPDAQEVVGIRNAAAILRPRHGNFKVERYAHVLIINYPYTSMSLLHLDHICGYLLQLPEGKQNNTNIVHFSYRPAYPPYPHYYLRIECKSEEAAQAYERALNDVLGTTPMTDEQRKSFCIVQ